ncbi:MAG: nitrogen regulation protein NR(II) [Thermodesulfobacteriota bacterium]
MAQASTQNTLKGKLLAMMVLRVVLALAFLGITTWFQVREYSYTRLNFQPLYFIVAVVGFLTIFYALALGRVRNLRLFVYLQVTVDIVLTSVIVYVTGGTESYLQILYPLSVIGATIMVGMRGGLYAASLSSISYGVLMDADFYNMLPARFKVLPSTALQPGWEDVFMTVATNILAFFTVAYLTGYLAEKTAKVEKKLEEKETDLVKLEGLNRHIVENITSGIMTLDGNHRITSFNREAESVTGYSAKEVYHKDVREFFPDMLSSGKRAARVGARVEKKFRKKDGEEIFLGFSVSRGQGGDVDSIIIFQDLTRLRAMEEQLRRDEKLKALGELSVGIAHEIRNPLASISGSIQVLKDEVSLDGDNNKLMEIVLRETSRLNMLITDYLLFARPARETREVVDLNAIIGETIQLFANAPEASDIGIESDLPGSVFIKADARQLGQVFWNLFLNAAHAMSGSGTLAVSSHLSPGAGEAGVSGDAGEEPATVSVTVADTGTGIDREDLLRIFDPFFSTKDSGTGLGLAIVHRIIETHGGRIDVQSDAGGGTVFTIVLPVLAEGATLH